MKANEAPEKIYIVIDPIWGSMSVNYNCNDTDNIEYSRTDAFIEKTCDWLDDLVLSDYVDIKETSDGTFVTFNQDKLVKDFRTYMKGE